jgi:hypothetical protein
LWWDNQLYPFTTYNGATLNIVKIKDQEIEIEVQNSHYLLRVKAEMVNQGQLHGPFENQMLSRVSESLDSRLELEFYKRRGDQLHRILKVSGQPAGVEANGRLEELIPR